MLSNIILRSTAAFGGAPFRFKKCTALGSAGAGAASGAAVGGVPGALVGAYGEEKKEDESNPSECQQRMKLSAGWIVCSGLELLSSGMDTLFGYIDSLLNVNVIKLNASDDQGLYKSWSYFRGIATFMLFAVGLVMIIY